MHTLSLRKTRHHSLASYNTASPLRPSQHGINPPAPLHDTARPPDRIRSLLLQHGMHAPPLLQHYGITSLYTQPLTDTSSPLSPRTDFPSKAASASSPILNTSITLSLLQHGHPISPALLDAAITPARPLNTGITLSRPLLQQGITPRPPLLSTRHHCSSPCLNRQGITARPPANNTASPLPAYNTAHPPPTNQRHQHHNSSPSPLTTRHQPLPSPPDNTVNHTSPSATPASACSPADNTAFTSPLQRMPSCKNHGITPPHPRACPQTQRAIYASSPLLKRITRPHPQRILHLLQHGHQPSSSHHLPSYNTGITLSRPLQQRQNHALSPLPTTTGHFHRIPPASTYTASLSPPPTTRQIIPLLNTHHRYFGPRLACNSHQNRSGPPLQTRHHACSPSCRHVNHPLLAF
nr:proline-rich protein 36-like [Salvelinus alpinus]